MLGPRTLRVLFFTLLAVMLVCLPWPISSGRRCPPRGGIQPVMICQTDSDLGVITSAGLDGCEPDNDAGWAWYRRGVHREGFVHTRTTYNSFGLTFDFYADSAVPATSASTTALRKLVVTALLADTDMKNYLHFDGDRLIAGDYTDRTDHLDGWIAEIIAYSTIALLGIAWLFVLRRAWRHDLVAHRAAQPHLCSRCGYDLVGLTAARCPECGETARISTSPAADQAL